MPSQTVRIVNTRGLHARAAARFVQLANSFCSEIYLHCHHNQQRGNGKQILDLLTLVATQGSDITITANGGDAQVALEQLCALVQNGFGEEN